jgi:hypothetical protein
MKISNFVRIACGALMLGVLTALDSLGVNKWKALLAATAFAVALFGTLVVIVLELNNGNKRN